MVLSHPKSEPVVAMTVCPCRRHLQRRTMTVPAESLSLLQRTLRAAGQWKLPGKE